MAQKGNNFLFNSIAASILLVLLLSQDGEYIAYSIFPLP